MGEFYHMSRLIFVPQFPTKLRYQEWFYIEFPKEFRKHFDEVITLGQSYVSLKGSMEARSDKAMFSPIRDSFVMEHNQINEYQDLKLYDDDILLLMDLSFPGFFSNVLYHKPTKNAFAYCHATSKNAYDYFAPVRKSKWLVETAHSKLFKKVFVATYYHQYKLGWKNTEVVGLPKPPFRTFNADKKYHIISVSRPCRQKVDNKLEHKIEEYFKTKVYRKECYSWREYYEFLSQGRVLLITTKEDTFGYQALEAIMNNTCVVAPNKFSYPELLPHACLYDSFEDALVKIAIPEIVTTLSNQDIIDNFYNSIIRIMKEESNE